MVREPRVVWVGVGATIRGMSRSERAWANWWGLVAAQERSGLSVRRFCIERGLAASSLFAWRRKLGEAEATRAGRQGGAGRERSAPTGATPGRRPAFVEAMIAREVASAPARDLRDRATPDDWRWGGAGGVAVELACGRRIIVRRGFDHHLLRVEARRLNATIVFYDDSGFMLRPLVRQTWSPREVTLIVRCWDRRDRLADAGAGPRATCRSGRRVGSHKFETRSGSDPNPAVKQRGCQPERMRV